MSDTESLSGGGEEVEIDDQPNVLPNPTGADDDLSNSESNEIQNQMEDDSNLTECLEENVKKIIKCREVNVKKELEEIVQKWTNKKTLPDLVAELIMKKQLNTIIVDLHDFTKGFDLSCHEYGKEEEIYLGTYSYAVSLIEYIIDGEIPYDLFDILYNYQEYQFQLYYDGYVPCQIRINFEQEGFLRSHFVLLQYTMQTIDAESLMNCKEAENLDLEMERARLISHYSSDLCLDPDPRLAEIVISNELNQYPFIIPYFKYTIKNEKARLEKGVRDMPKNSANYSEPKPKKPDYKDWDFRSNDPTEEEAELSKMASRMKMKPPLASYLKERKICFPDKDSFTGFHVEIENFVYEYDGRTRAGNVESIQDTLCIGVLDDKEFYYGALKLDERMKKWYPFRWWEIGNTREAVDIYVNGYTREQMKLCCGGMKITHNRIFDEKIEVCDGGVKIVRHKLENPVSQVVLEKPSPASRAASGSTNKS